MIHFQLKDMPVGHTTRIARILHCPQKDTIQAIDCAPQLQDRLLHAAAATRGMAFYTAGQRAVSILKLILNERH